MFSLYLNFSRHAVKWHPFISGGDSVTQSASGRDRSYGDIWILARQELPHGVSGKEKLMHFGTSAATGVARRQRGSSPIRLRGPQTYKNEECEQFIRIEVLNPRTDLRLNIDYIDRK